MSKSERPKKQRIDQLLVDRGLVESRTKAKAHVMAGLVVVNDMRVDKPGTQVKADAHIRVKGSAFPDVSRAGLKLRGAIEQWPFEVNNHICLDIGACTGGFTDVLLKYGAQKVFAVDVGHNQLHWSLRTHPQVVNLEKTHIVHMPIGTLSEQPTRVVCDVSFISLTRVIPAVLKHLADETELVLLIKPQFEAERHEVGKGGIIRDDSLRKNIRDRVFTALGDESLQLIEAIPSPITGTEGNIEYISYWRYQRLNNP